MYLESLAIPSRFLYPTLGAFPGAPGDTEPSKVKVVLIPGKTGLHPVSHASCANFIKWGQEVRVMLPVLEKG